VDAASPAASAPAASASATGQVRQALEETGQPYEEVRAGEFVVTLPGERKQRTTVSLVVDAHSLTVTAFVARRPDENAEAVYRWLLERNLRTYVVAFALDRLGDVYLTGRLPLAAVTAAEVDRVLGAVLQAADSSFDVILELGFATAIRTEWAWRTSRGESTANLAAFAHLLERSERGRG
jgi:Putative bacterial sensory transduction regulator